MQNEDNKNKKSFFKGMNGELKKVIWPTGKQTLKSTAITIGFVLLISVILIIFNVIFEFISEAWFGLLIGDDEVKQNPIIMTSGETSGEALSGETTSGENTENDVESGENNA